ncbi:uncharacterized protein LOC143275809 [Babylonia areolata]|uniref:uncharacterized protein LOC143275809 n=1 Tax=Babylonia areolata TaxID=304850 RepID=UPI003FD6A81C
MVVGVVMEEATATTVADAENFPEADNQTMPPGVVAGNRTDAARAPEGCVVLSVKPGAFIPWDNPDNLISREVEVAVDTAVAVLFLPILFSISAPCNVLNMIVFCKQGLKERINLCLFSLSLADSLYMLHSFILNMDKIYSQFTRAGPGVGPVFELVVNNHLMFIRGFNWVSGFFSMVIACERCLCVFSPLRSQTILKTKTTGVVLAVAAVLLLGMMYIGTSRWATACVFDPVTNTSSKKIYPSKFYTQHQEMVDIITGLLASLLLPGIYISVVSATTSLTFIRLRKMAAWREQTSSATMSSREVALTRMLIGVSVLYVICSTPVLALGVCLLFVPDMSLQGRYYNAFNLMVSFFELFSYINASFNFFVYCFLGTKYKETLREMCCQCSCLGRKKEK